MDLCTEQNWASDNGPVSIISQLDLKIGELSQGANAEQ